MKNRLTLFVSSALLLCAAVIFSRPASAQTAPRKIQVTAHRFAFSPSEITLKNHEPVVLVFTSTDVAHGLRVSELKINVKIPKGGTAEAPVTPDKTGDFVGHCAVFCGSGHGGMTLTLHVVE